MKVVIIFFIILFLFSCKREKCSEEILGDISDKLIKEDFISSKLLQIDTLIYVDSTGNELRIPKIEDGNYFNSELGVTSCKTGFLQSKMGDRILSKGYQKGFRGKYYYDNDSNNIYFSYKLEHIYNSYKNNKDSLIYYTRLSFWFSIRNTFTVYFDKLKSAVYFDADEKLEGISSFSKDYIIKELEKYQTPNKEYSKIYNISQKELQNPKNIPILSEVWISEEDFLVQFKLTNGHTYWLKE